MSPEKLKQKKLNLEKTNKKEFGNKLNRFHRALIYGVMLIIVKQNQNLR